MNRMPLRFFNTVNCKLNLPIFKHPAQSFFKDLTEKYIKDIPRETMVYVGRNFLKNARFITSEYRELNIDNVPCIMNHVGNAISHFHLALSRYIRMHEEMPSCNIDFSPKRIYTEGTSAKDFIENLLKHLIADLNRTNVRWGRFNVETMPYRELRGGIPIYRSHLTSAIQDLVLIQNISGDVLDKLTLENKNECKISLS